MEENIPQQPIQSAENQAPNQISKPFFKRKKVYLIFTAALIAVIVVIVGGLWIWKNYFSEAYCNNLTEKISTKITKLDKTCQSDENCNAAEITGTHLICVNKGEGLGEIKSLQELQYKRCKTFLPDDLINPVPFYGCECRANTCTSIGDAIQSNISDWHTYTSEEYGFEIKYPNDLALKEYPKNDSGDLGIQPWLFNVDFSGNGRVIKFFVRDFNRVSREWCSNSIGGNFDGSIIINGQEQEKCLHPEFGDSEISEYSISVAQKDSIFFDFDCGDLSYSQLCDQMLSSFRFIE